MATFGEELSRLIVEKGLTQKAVAEACGVNQTFIGKLIRGERDRLGSDILFKLCDVLDVGCDHFRPFLAGSPATPPQPAKGRRKKPG